jgi:hypothetical protein
MDSSRKEVYDLVASMHDLGQVKNHLLLDGSPEQILQKHMFCIARYA